MNVFAHRYAIFFEQLNKDTSLEEYKLFFNDESYFEDPFHKVVGIEKIYPIFEKMYEAFYKASFRVIESVSDGKITYLRWEFQYARLAEDELSSFEGVSRVEFDEHGYVRSHIDFWDAATHVYEKIPLIKSVLGYIKRKINES